MLVFWVNKCFYLEQVPGVLLRQQMIQMRKKIHYGNLTAYPQQPSALSLGLRVQLARMLLPTNGSKP